ncbi:uncharacterized protein THITE_2092812 [Thermothielavioides terrestris NRRL 8126]|uniref:Uncharacterized protein n=1 Tax=Thermothielavioides terrestris (strain ATCC 38088 / NRRL 8126) TaxID=578455 RepID=G2RHJ2_THETT|nr:uncharacterized protein THITE_2092812 [Thermothielavioides terrestris NRRL 8126]AEO71304.1 hypothetical protein THITE_2092812 [Thermothielavioides terrestris NRRL 8126]
MSDTRDRHAPEPGLVPPCEAIPDDTVLRTVPVLAPVDPPSRPGNPITPPSRTASPSLDTAPCNLSPSAPNALCSLHLSSDQEGGSRCSGTLSPPESPSGPAASLHTAVPAVDDAPGTGSGAGPTPSSRCSVPSLFANLPPLPIWESSSSSSSAGSAAGVHPPGVPPSGAGTGAQDEEDLPAASPSFDEHSPLVDQTDGVESSEQSVSSEASVPRETGSSADSSPLVSNRSSDDRSPPLRRSYADAVRGRADATSPSREDSASDIAMVFSSDEEKLSLRGIRPARMMGRRRFLRKVRADRINDPE